MTRSSTNSCGATGQKHAGLRQGNAVLHVNKSLPAAARIQRFVNLHKEFDADDDELTRTRKLRRAFLEERYQAIVDGLYSGAGEISLDTTVTYEDGRTSRSQHTLRVVESG